MVSVHTDEHAATASAALDARAFSVGHDIYFGAGAYAPATPDGRSTLAHEVAHVVQHKLRGGHTSGEPALSSPTDREEDEAERFAAAPGAVRLGPATRHAIFRQPVTGRQARAVGGEAGMGFTGYSMQQGWGFLTGPSGGAGHAWNAPGFDGVAFRTDGAFELHIVDNKSFARAGNVASASALTTNLEQNLDGLIATAGEARFNTVPRIDQVRASLRAARAAVASGAPLPPEVQLVVTNAGGRSTGITARLAGQGVVFRDLMAGPTGGGLGASTAGAASEEIRAEARAAARTAAGEISSEMRLVRVARVIGTAMQLLQLWSDLMLLVDFTQMTEHAIAGEGFFMTTEIAQAESLADSSERLVNDYRPESDRIQSTGWNLLAAALDPTSAGRAASSLSDTSFQLTQIRHDLADRLVQIDAAQHEAEAKEHAAQAILESRDTSGFIAAATFGTAELARVFAAWQDLGRINAGLIRAGTALRELDAMLGSDIEFLDHWFDYLFGLCKEGGICAEGTITIPFLFESHWRLLPGDEQEQ